MKKKALKKALVEDGTFTKYRKRYGKLYEKGLDFDKIEETLKEEFGNDNAIACAQLLEGRRKQKKKIMNQLEYWRNRKAGIYFLTFTYKDGAFRTNNIAKQMKDRVTKVLREFDDYSVNIDYGKKNERLHFHAIAYLNPNRIKEEKQITGEDYKTKGDTDFDHLELEFYREETGIVYIKKCKTEDVDEVKLARYIAKITTHSLKVKQSYVATKKGSDYQDAQKWQRWIKKMKSLRYYNIEKELPEVTKLAYGAYFDSQYSLLTMREYVVDIIEKNDKWHNKDRLGYIK